MSKLQKQLILGFAVVLLGLFSWYFLKYVFYIGNLTLSCWISGIILLIVWGIALCLAMLLIDNKAVLYGSFIITLALFFIFFTNQAFYYFIFLLIALLCFWAGSRRVRKEEEAQVRFNFWRIWKRGLPIVITGLILVVALLYYFSPSLMKMKQVEFKISRNTFNLVITPLEDLIEKRLPGTVELDAEATKIMSQEQIKELEEKYGITVKKEDTGKDILYQLVNFQLTNATGPYRKFIPIGLAIAMFIGLKIASIIYVALVVLLSWLALELLMVLKFVKTKMETKEVETIKL
jgi:hypothetical protein